MNSFIYMNENYIYWLRCVGELMIMKWLSYFIFFGYCSIIYYDIGNFLGMSLKEYFYWI